MQNSDATPNDNLTPEQRAEREGREVTPEEQKRIDESQRNEKRDRDAAAGRK